MKDYERFPPTHIQRAQGCYFYDKNNRPIIDAISSWWCKGLGHGHPRLKQALLRQLEKFEHVLLPNTTHEVLTELASQLTALAPWTGHVFFAGDGSCAIEVALKMSLHWRTIAGESRSKVLCLSHGYHGETALALSVSDVGQYKQPYQAFLHEMPMIHSIPYITGPDDPLWHDCSEIWPMIEAQLKVWASEATALIFEPIVQGAGGMLVYSADFLKRLVTFAKAHNIHCIADEIMTGMGRTGTMLACEHAKVQPDMICLSKGLTSGWLPMSVVLTTPHIYDAFYDDYDTGKAFLHSHTYSGNPLAASVALETIKVLQDEAVLTNVSKLATQMHQHLREIQSSTGLIHNIRGLGGVFAADLCTLPNQRAGFSVFQKAVQKGAWLRPLGNTIYWLPPLNSTSHTIDALASITEAAIIEGLREFA